MRVVLCCRWIPIGVYIGSSALRGNEFKCLICVDKPIRASGKVVSFVTVITVLSWRLDVAFAIAAKLPRLTLDGLLTLLGGHAWLLALGGV